MASFILHYNPWEEDFLYRIKDIVAGRAKVFLTKTNPAAVMELIIIAKEKNCKCVATSNEKLARWLVKWDDKDTRKKFSLDAFAGSIIERNGIEFLILPSLDKLVKVNYGQFIIKRFLNKLIVPESFIKMPAFDNQWEVFMPQNADRIYAEFRNATFVSSDNETGSEEDKTITCTGFTAVTIDTKSNSYTTSTVVIPYTSEFNLAFSRKLLNLPQPKVFQNGKYDIAYHLRYNSPVRNYAFDTINLFHCWYSELPKDLGFIPLFLLRNWVYHKFEKDTLDELIYYQYNAKDAFITAMSFLALLYELPDYAIKNYLIEFPTVFPCILVENTGIRCDVNAMRELAKQSEEAFKGDLKSIQTMVSNSLFNPGSPPQCAKLFTVLGCEDIKGTGKIPIDKASARHPINERILKSIKAFREGRKAYGTYFDETKLWHNRIFYTLNPHGTTTGRFASKESHFWCGLQIQNIPRDKEEVAAKRMFVADNGFYLGESDLEQAEARDTAYLSGDLRLIATVDDTTKDYHGINASSFFGMPYEKIIKSYQDDEGHWIHKKLDKELRDLAKRTNHGANYNMGPSVLLDTMGIKNVIRAKQLLKLPASWSLHKVCEYLLDKFSNTYSTVKGPWYKKVISDVENTHMLVGPTGWTRYCFGHPAKNKLDLNAYVAHPPQSLNAMVLNKAWLKVFEIWKENPNDFWPLAQIHDSILFQYRIGRLDLAIKVKRAMEIPITVNDTFGIRRTLLVPAALKAENIRWSELKDIAA